MLGSERIERIKATLVGVAAAAPQRAESHGRAVQRRRGADQGHRHYGTLACPVPRRTFNVTSSSYYRPEDLNMHLQEPNFGMAFASQAATPNGYPCQVQLRIKRFW